MDPNLLDQGITDFDEVDADGGECLGNMKSMVKIVQVECDLHGILAP
ncbi:hypothetical protein SAMN05421505_11035 [Sinosporangium album]|uniref:Uncharacterized protein n=1 Tax=Sinosporangium album TaxID=504805 RepID=A0A1G7YR83_9ACTN|nr:hypothetical protein SAMN05421505_11035 [Sinosporangium album]